MRKNFNKLATLALSGMMVMSMAVPAFAANLETKTGAFTKVLHTDGKTYAPNTTFTFKVTALAPASYTVKNPDGSVNSTVTTLQAEEGALKVDPITFSPTGTFETDERDGLGVLDANGASFTRKTNFVIDKDLLKKGNGYYKFELEENNSGYEGIRYASGKFYVYVLLYEENGVKKTEVAVERQGATIKGVAMPAEKVDKINNNYGKHNPPETPDLPPETPKTPENPNPKDPTPNDSTHDVTIVKKIEGSVRNTAETFKFSVKIVPSNGGERYHVESVGGSTLGFTYIDANTDSAEFTVTENTGIRIYGLTKSDKIIVTEADGKQYTMSVRHGDKEDGSGKEDDTYVNPLAMVSGEKYKAEMNVLKDKSHVEVVNTKDKVTPTGIVMNVAPYALMLAVAGGMGVVFVNRKKEEE